MSAHSHHKEVDDIYLTLGVSSISVESASVSLEDSVSYSSSLSSNSACSFSSSCGSASSSESGRVSAQANSSISSKSILVELLDPLASLAEHRETE